MEGDIHYVYILRVRTGISIHTNHVFIVQAITKLQNASETGPDPSKINANSIRPDLIYCPGHARHQTSYQYLQPINNPLV